MKILLCPHIQCGWDLRLGKCPIPGFGSFRKTTLPRRGRFCESKTQKCPEDPRTGAASEGTRSTAGPAQVALDQRGGQEGYLQRLLTIARVLPRNTGRLGAGHPRAMGAERGI